PQPIVHMLPSTYDTNLSALYPFLPIFLLTHTRQVPPISFQCPAEHPDLPSFPTRRSSDLLPPADRRPGVHHRALVDPLTEPDQQDRKSTRLNSTHVSISYAVFCMTKKRNKIDSFI